MGVARQRRILARTLDHGKMKGICEDHVKAFYNSGQPPSGVQLKNVAHTLVQLQEKRHTADYDNAFAWSRTNAIAAIDMVSAAFGDWKAIRTQETAQDYLQLFLPKMPRVWAAPKSTAREMRTHPAPYPRQTGCGVSEVGGRVALAAIDSKRQQGAAYDTSAHSSINIQESATSDQPLDCGMPMMKGPRQIGILSMTLPVISLQGRRTLPTMRIFSKISDLVTQNPGFTPPAPQ